MARREPGLRVPQRLNGAPLAGAAGAVAMALPARDAWELVLGAFLGTVAGWLAAVDVREHRLPDRVQLPAAAVLLAALALRAVVGTDPGALARALAVSAATGLVLLLLAAASRGGLGFGDVKFGMLLGLWTGYLGPAQGVLALVAAFLSGGVAAVAALLTGRAGPTTRIAFGPFLAVGALAATWWSAFA